MGQAKLRGSRDERVAEGIRKREAEERALAEKRELERRALVALREAEIHRHEKARLKASVSARAGLAHNGTSASGARMALRAGVSLASLALANAALVSEKQ